LMFIIIGVRNKWIWGVIPEVNLAGSNHGNGSEGSEIPETDLRGWQRGGR